jgi:hypothetical protein
LHPAGRVKARAPRHDGATIALGRARHRCPSGPIGTCPTSVMSGLPVDTLSFWRPQGSAGGATLSVLDAGRHEAGREDERRPEWRRGQTERLSYPPWGQGRRLAVRIAPGRERVARNARGRAGGGRGGCGGAGAGDRSGDGERARDGYCRNETMRFEHTCLRWPGDWGRSPGDGCYAAIPRRVPPGK